MTQTSVATVWEPKLSGMSLPGGLPWPIDETTISNDSVAVLAAPEAIDARDAWLPHPQPTIVAHLLRGPDAFDTTSVRYQQVPGGIVFAYVTRRPEPGPAETHRLIVEVKAGLQLSWQGIVQLLDVPMRTLLTYHHAKSVPEDRLAALRPRVQVLWTALTRDPDAARVTVEQRGSELAQLFRRARFSDALTVFRQTSDQLHGTLTTADPTAMIVTHLDDFRRLSGEPAFREAVEAVATFGRRSTTYAAQRFEAEVELLAALDEARRGSVESSRWDFLPVLTFAAMDAMRARAQSYIHSGDFSPEGWRSLVETETSRAWEHYSPVRGEPESVGQTPEFSPEPTPSRRRLYRGQYSQRLGR